MSIETREALILASCQLTEVSKACSDLIGWDQIDGDKVNEVINTIHKVLHQMPNLEVSDFEIIAAMEKYGGRFVQCLALAARAADDENLRRIKETWAECWFKYSALAKDKRKNQVAAAILENKPLYEYGKDE